MVEHAVKKNNTNFSLLSFSLPYAEPRPSHKKNSTSIILSRLGVTGNPACKWYLVTYDTRGSYRKGLMKSWK